MNIISNLNNTVFSFKDQVTPLSTSYAKKIFFIVSIAFNCIAAVFLFKDYFIKKIKACFDKNNSLNDIQVVKGIQHQSNEHINSKDDLDPKDTDKKPIEKEKKENESVQDNILTMTPIVKKETSLETIETIEQINSKDNSDSKEINKKIINHPPLNKSVKLSRKEMLKKLEEEQTPLVKDDIKKFIPGLINIITSSGEGCQVGWWGDIYFDKNGRIQGVHGHDMDYFWFDSNRKDSNGLYHMRLTVRAANWNPTKTKAFEKDNSSGCGTFLFNTVMNLFLNELNQAAVEAWELSKNKPAMHRCYQNWFLVMTGYQP